MNFTSVFIKNTHPVTSMYIDGVSINADGLKIIKTTDL